MKDVSVKAKAKLSYVLDGDLLDGLIKEDNLSAKASYLRKNYDFLGADDEKIILEDKLRTHFYKELRSLEYFLTGLEKKFYQLYFSIFKIYLIQEIITSILNGSLAENLGYFRNNPYYKGMNLDLDTSFKDFIESLDDYHMKRVLEPFLNENMDKDSIIFLSSNALIKSYYRELLKISEKFPTKEAKIIKNFLAEEINLLNFEMLYRLKSFFDVNNSEIFNYLIEGGYLYNGQRLKMLSDLSKDDLMEYFKESKYKDIFEDENLFYKKMQDKKLKNFKDEIIKERSDMLYIISAMNILYLNMKNLIAILEMDDKYTNKQKEELLIGR
ncbi:V0D/AC39 family V-type ATPase subunit [Anaerococcus degeneri]|uniref:V-type ATPase subunit n=1 Tax=Anaerococcus degeneri TaxID=361500 RepID=A0ABS7YUG4_9FIRM|nr:V-type ATPase subunit [Anaerococcus degeneri]MBP2015105.1 V/A-type H+-transporting ATPase subunit C [Anaerococcus degeneri]MCA2095365.1 V-type ATPase subunit [Anaerococcus degeneri]